MFEPDPSDRELELRVENTVLKDVLDAAMDAAGDNVEAGVRDWWFVQYKAKFFCAILLKGMTYDDKAKTLLQGKAKELGETACRLADGGMVTRRHAAMASFEVDCPRTSILEHWCN